jgi:hypothetical protein
MASLTMPAVTVKTLCQQVHNYEQDQNIDLPANLTLNDIPQNVFGDISPVKPSSNWNNKTKKVPIMAPFDEKKTRVFNPDGCTFVPMQWEAGNQLRVTTHLHPPKVILLS